MASKEASVEAIIGRKLTNEDKDVWRAYLCAYAQAGCVDTFYKAEFRHDRYYAALAQAACDFKNEAPPSTLSTLTAELDDLLEVPLVELEKRAPEKKPVMKIEVAPKTEDVKVEMTKVTEVAVEKPAEKKEKEKVT